MAGAYDLYSGTNSVSGSNLFTIDKSPLSNSLGGPNKVGPLDSPIKNFSDFITFVGTSIIELIENLTGLNINQGPIAFLASIVDVLESLTGLVFGEGPMEFVKSMVRVFENLTGLNINDGPGPFFESLIDVFVVGPIESLIRFIHVLESTGATLAHKVAQAVITAIRGIPFVGDNLADFLQRAVNGMVNFLRGGNQSGANLLADPGAQVADFWIEQPEVTRVTGGSARIRSGTASLLVTSGGTNPKSFYWNVNDMGIVVPIITQPSDWFYAECWVFAPSVNQGAGTVTLVAEFRDSLDASRSQTSTVTQPITKNSWIKVSGTFKVPETYDRISFGFLLANGATTLGDQFFVDDLLVKEVTGQQQIIDTVHQAVMGPSGSTIATLTDVGYALGGIVDLSRGSASSGVNLLVDPKINYPNLWKATGLEVSSTAGTYRSSSRSLGLTSAGSTARTFDWTVDDTGSVQPIVAQPGDVFYCECYVLSPPGNNSATVTLHGKAVDSKTGSTLTLAPPITGQPVASGPWTKISGRYTIPDGYDGFRAGVTLSANLTTSGNKFYIDDLVVNEVTQAVAINTALYDQATPGATIDQAKVYNLPSDLLSIGGTASTAYSSAQGTIDNINQAVTGTAATGATAGTVKTNVSGLTYLTRGAVGAGTNLLADPSAEFNSFWTQTGLAPSTATKRSALQSLEFTSAGATERSFYFNVNDRGAVTPILTRPSDVFYVECYSFAPSTNADTGYFQLVARLINSVTGTATVSVIATVTPTKAVVGTSWVDANKASGNLTIPAGYDRVQFGIRLPANAAASGSKFYFDDMLVRELTAPTEAANAVGGGLSGNAKNFGTADLNDAAIGTANSISNLSTDVTAIKNELYGGYTGTATQENFAAMADSPTSLGTAWTQSYSGGTSKLGITGGRAAWYNSGDLQTCSAVYSTPTQGLYQRVSVVMGSTIAEQGAFRIIGRSNAAGTTYVWAELGPSRSNWRLGYTINGASSTIVTSAQSTAALSGSTYSAQFGKSPNTNSVELYFNGTSISWTDSSRLFPYWDDTAYRYTGFWSKATATPPQVSSFSFYDNSQSQNLGSGLIVRASAAAALAANRVTLASTFVYLPNGYFNTEQKRTSDITFNSADNSFTVSVDGWYLIEVNMLFGTGITQNFSYQTTLWGPSNVPKGTTFLYPSNSSTFQYGVNDSFIVYLNRSETVRLGKDNNLGTGVSIANALAANSKLFVTFLGNKKPVNPPS